MSENPEIQGELALQTLAMPKDTNANGDIFVSFLSPVKVGATVSRYCRVEKKAAPLCILWRLFELAASESE